MLSPVTLIRWAASGLGAGPATTSPVLMLYWLPWQGQSMVPLLMVLTMQPMCVHTALNALNSPLDGCVTTTCWLVKIMPLPTGIWPGVASAPAAAPPALAPEAARVLAGAAWVVPAPPAGALLDPPPQAVIAPARPARPTPARTPRRVASESVGGSCVTTSPRRSCGCRCGW